MSKSSEISYIQSADRLATSKYPKHTEIHAVFETTIRNLNELLRGMFDGVDDSLFELANNARTNNEQNRFFEAMRDVRIKRKGIEANFSQTVQSLFEPKSVLSTSPVKPNNHITDADNLSLVGNDDLEEDVAISSMANKALSNYQGGLLQFQTRIAKLYGAKNTKEISYPLDPLKLCHAFAASCSNLEVDIKERLLIYKQFDRYVMSHLDSVIDASNETLVKQGILPDLKSFGASSKQQSTRTNTGNRKATPQQDQETLEGHPSQHLQEDLFPILQSLLQQGRPDQALTRTDSQPAPDLLALLTSIQKDVNKNLGKPNENSAFDIRAALVHEIQKSSHVQAGTSLLRPIDEDLINLVSMLFDFILEDYNLAPSIQVLISRLQIPILKIVVKDKSFFSTSKHPARHLLNSIAKAGIACGETQDKSRDSLYGKIHSIVHRILNEFDGDIRLFEELNISFAAFLNKEERKTSIVEQRTREAEAGRIRTQQAQQQVEKALSKQILSVHHAIPDIVIDMLKNGWSRVMFLAYLKDAEEHQWQHTVDISHDLIWCLQPLSKPKERQRWITIVPKLLKELDAGLRNVSYNTSNLDITMSELKQALTSSFKESSYTHLESKASKQKPSALIDRNEPSDKNLANKTKPLPENENLNLQLSKISELKIGQWVEFTLMNGSKYRCKLSAQLKEADCYIFVNRAGLKPIEKTRLELAKDLETGKAVLLEQGLIIDRAMSSIMSNLRQRTSD